MIPVFDIEAVGWSKPIAVGFYDGYKYFEFLKETEDDDVLWRFLSYLAENFKGGKIYAHCAATYDNKLLLACLCSHNEEIALEAGLARLKWKKPDITFEDSYLLIPFPLKRLHKVFGVLEKGEWEHEKNLKPWEMGEELCTFKDYLKQDCIILSNALVKVCELIGTNFGVMPSISLSATSVKAFSKLFFKIDNIDSNEPHEEPIRLATYGGRNEVYKRYGENINHYDVKRQYVSCYDTPLPVSKMSWCQPSMDRGTLAEAEVKVPKDWFIGPLPYRLNEHLCFPVGEFSGWWDMRELRNAANKGVDVTLKRQLECEEAPLLLEFGKSIGELSETPEGDYWKLFGLSPIGKFGQSRWMDITKHFTEIGDFLGFSPLDEEELYFTTKIYSKHHPYIKPALSMRVRAEARVRHYNLLTEAHKRGEIYYGDTDSVFTKAEMSTGKSMGDLVLLGKAERGYFVRQKLYALIENGKMRQRSSGYSDLKLSEEDFKRLLEGEDIQIDKVNLSTLRSILKTKEVKVLERYSRVIGKASESRICHGIDTEPICLP